MMPDETRRLALALPEAQECAHMGKADFRVRDKIFAALPDAGRIVLKLRPEQQALMTAAEPVIFTALPGGWGRRGWTSVSLAAVDATTLAGALRTAWRNVAPKKLAAAQGA